MLSFSATSNRMMSEIHGATCALEGIKMDIHSLREWVKLQRQNSSREPQLTVRPLTMNVDTSITNKEEVDGINQSDNQGRVGTHWDQDLDLL